MKEKLKFTLDFHEETKERERLIEEYGEDYVLDNPKYWNSDIRYGLDPNVESHCQILIDEVKDGRLKITFEGRFPWFGQFMEEDLRILSKVPGVEADLSVRPVDGVITKKFKLKDGRLEVSEEV